MKTKSKRKNVDEQKTSSRWEERLVSGSFAPSPWHIGEANPWLIYAADGYAVADVRSYHGRHPDAKGDARLIAAAPEMLDALERIREYQGRFGEDDPQSIAADMLAKISSTNFKELATRGLEPAPENHAGDGQTSRDT